MGSQAVDKSFLDVKLRLRSRTVGANAILDGDFALFVLAQRRVYPPGILAHVSVDDGEVFFLDGAVFPHPAEGAGGFGIFGHHNDAAGFAVQTVNQVTGQRFSRSARIFPGRLAAFTQARSFQVKPDTANETGPLAIFCGMADQPGRFVDDQQVSVLVDDVKKSVQCGKSGCHAGTPIARINGRSFTDCARVAGLKSFDSAEKLRNQRARPLEAVRADP